jgi:hypothetical protein
MNDHALQLKLQFLSPLICLINYCLEIRNEALCYRHRIQIYCVKGKLLIEFEEYYTDAK